MWMLSTKMLPAAAVLLIPMTFLTKNVLGVLTPLSGHRSVPDQPPVVWMLFTYFKERSSKRAKWTPHMGEIKEILSRWHGALDLPALLTFISSERRPTGRCLTTIDAATLSKLIEGNRAGRFVLWSLISRLNRGSCANHPWLVLSEVLQGLTFGVGNAKRGSNT
jgi:sorbitol/mannitol transport system permease protein